MAALVEERLIYHLDEQYKIRKMKVVSILFALTVFIFISLNLNAQETKIWSLEDCINYALDHNVNVKKQSLNINYQEDVLMQSKLGLLPNVNGYASHGYNWGKRIDPFTNEFATDRVRSNNFYLQGDLNLFNGLQQVNTIKKNMLTLLAARYDVDYYRDEISINVATQYLQTLYSMDNVAIAQNQLDITKQQVERTRKLVDAGTLAKGDLLTIEAQEATEELALVNSQNDLDLSYLTLSQLLELPTTEGLEIEKPELGLISEPEIYTPVQIYQTALANRPEIKSAETKVESSQKDLDIARGAYYPSLSLGGSYGTGYSGVKNVGVNPTTISNPEIGYTQSGEAVYSLQNYTTYESFKVKPFSDQLNDNLNKSVGLNLRIPIFNGWRSRSNVAQAKIGIESANFDYELEKNNLYKSIQQAYNDAVAASNKYKAADKKVKATSESFDYAEQKFNVGLINSVDYNNAKKEYDNALSEMVQAKYEFVFKTTIIDFYMGKPLTLKK